MNVGLIGCGNGGQDWGQRLVKRDWLTWVSDGEMEGRSRARAFFGSKVIPERDSSAIDAVVISTEIHKRADHILWALDAGLHVLVDGTMTTDQNEAKAIHIAAEVAGCAVVAYQPLLYSDAVLQTLEWMQELGDLRHVRVTWAGRPSVIPWGGVVWEYGPHLLSVVSLVVDAPPVGLSAAVGARSPEGLATIATVRLRWEEEDVTVDANLSLEEPEPAHEIAVSCEDGQILCRPMSGEVSVWRNDRRKETTILRDAGTSRDLALDDLERSHEDQTQPFANVGHGMVLSRVLSTVTEMTTVEREIPVART